MLLLQCLGLRWVQMKCHQSGCHVQLQCQQWAFGRLTVQEEGHLLTLDSCVMDGLGLGFLTYFLGVGDVEVHGPICLDNLAVSYSQV